MGFNSGFKGLNTLSIEGTLQCSNGLNTKQKYGKEGKHRLQNFGGQISREAWFQAIWDLRSSGVLRSVVW